MCKQKQRKKKRKKSHPKPTPYTSGSLSGCIRVFLVFLAGLRVNIPDNLVLSASQREAGWPMKRRQIQGAELAERNCVTSLGSLQIDLLKKTVPNSYRYCLE